MSGIYYLSHGGPGSGRYPLGSGERPYQKYEGSSGGSSRISGYIRSRRAKKVEEQKQKEEEKQKIEAEKKRFHDADKDRVLKSGTATEVLKYKGELSNQELQNAFTRLNLEANLRNLSQRETITNMDRIDKIMKNVKTGTEWAKIGTDTYNTFASIYNATSSGKNSPLTLVGKGDTNKKK